MVLQGGGDAGGEELGLFRAKEMIWARHRNKVGFVALFITASDTELIGVVLWSVEEPRSFVS